MKIKKDTWVFVADGSKALILENQGTPMTPNLRVVRSAKLITPPTRELGRDRPGRMPDASSPHRSGMEAPDLHEREEERFLSEQIDGLLADRANQKFKSLVVVAPPIALGRIRKAMDEPLKSSVVATFDKGIAHRPIEEICSAVAEYPNP
ncbi:MAG: host attachment family protein [Pseudomonadota bacterium]